MAESAAYAIPRDLLGHPRGLFYLFFAEMWERFSFYGMRGLLVLYLTQHFLFSDGDSAAIYATYGSLVYLMPVIGGLIADHYLGFRRAIVFGAILLCLGHLGMAFEGDPAQLHEGAVVRDGESLQVFYLSLALIIVGVGFVKPNISSIVGQLYGPTDPRRDSGFTLFYMGINLGALLASLTCGYLGVNYGWRYGFGLAGIGMLVGLLTFLRGRPTLLGAGEPNDPQALKHKLLPGLSVEHSIYLGGILTVFVSWWLVQSHLLVGQLLTLTAVIAVGGITWFSFRHCTAVERDRMIVVMLLTFVSVVFWALFEQAGSSMTLFTDRNVIRELFGISLETPQFQSLNPAFILLLALPFSLLWPALAARGWEPAAPAKFALAVVQVGLGFFALVYGASLADENAMVSAWWLVLAYLLHTTGELCLSPVGLSMVTKLSVPRVVGLMMGVWFLASAFSHYVAGFIAQAASVTTTQGEVSDPHLALATYSEVFNQIGWIGVGFGVLLLVVSPLLKRLMHEEFHSTNVTNNPFKAPS